MVIIRRTFVLGWLEFEYVSGRSNISILFCLIELCTKLIVSFIGYLSNATLKSISGWYLVANFCIAFWVTVNFTYAKIVRPTVEGARVVERVPKNQRVLFRQESLGTLHHEQRSLLSQGRLSVIASHSSARDCNSTMWFAPSRHSAEEMNSLNSSCVTRQPT